MSRHDVFVWVDLLLRENESQRKPTHSTNPTYSTHSMLSCPVHLSRSHDLRSLQLPLCLLEAILSPSP